MCKPVRQSDDQRPADVLDSDAKLFDGWKGSGLSRRKFLHNLNVDDIKEGIRSIDRERKRREKNPV